MPYSPEMADFGRLATRKWLKTQAGG